MNQPWSRAGVCLARFALSAWVGAALLFVIDGVRLITADAFDSVERDVIALMRFPPYYAMGAVLMALSAAGLIAGRRAPNLSGRRWTSVLVLTLLGSALLLGDYLWIYGPLAEMITPPGSPRPAGFARLHHVSEAINALQVGLCFAAAVILNWPTSAERPAQRGSLG